MFASFVKPTSERPKSKKNTYVLSNPALFSHLLSKDSFNPAISVIIPVYNRKQYIGECLDSLLAQTFQNFEIIVIDDSSTDNSVEIVESYLPKFGERLKIIKLEKNTGHPGIPRNKGIAIAQGEYIYCLDSDDIITETAFEEMYGLGQKYDADVVYCEKYYKSESIGKEFRDNIRITDSRLQQPPFVEKPTLDTNDLSERVRKFLRGNYWMSPALRFVKRDLLIENDIKFPDLVGSEDDVWSMEIVFCSKRFLRIPNICFIRRIHEDGISFGKYTTSAHVQRWMDLTIRNLKEMDNFLQKIDFFRENPIHRYEILARSVNSGFAQIFEKCAPESAFDIYNIFQEKFGKSLGEYDVLISSLCAYAVNQQKKSIQETNRRIAEKDAEINRLKKRIGYFPPPLPALHSSFPAISVIIPMYNVEKYVGECLDSLLAQTFQNFEVIVVDDCSTDSSCFVVESYIPKFEGRLTLAHMKKNSGGAGFPRNKGIKLSRGEYLSFIDPDDTITTTALEELYQEAKNFDADVVQSEKWYQLPEVSYYDPVCRKNLKPYSWPTKEKIFITKPTLLTDDLEARIIDFSKRWLTWSVCLQLVRREFILKNELTFTSIHAEDMLFTICELCCAKKYVVVPNVFYLYRLREGSAIREVFDVPKMIHKYLSTLKYAINYLDEFLNRQELFLKRTDLKYVLFNTFVMEVIGRLNRVYLQTPAYALDELLRKEFDSDIAFSAFIFNTMNSYRLKLNPAQENGIAPKNTANPLKVSVIIPLYNSEKYIGECLDSILAQTFQDFEVIVVDDCSTDNSFKIVEIYAPKFNGRLKLTKTEKNTGSPGDPGNIGVNLSRGEYLLILDNDDTIAPDALEKLYTVASNFDADVVTCEKYYKIPEESWYDVEFRKQLNPYSYKVGDFVNEPTLIPFDIAERVRACHQRKFLWPLWCKLIRRTFLIESKIRFTNNIIQDMLATCCLAYTAKRFVRVPYIINFYRFRNASLQHQNREPIKQMKKYLNALTVGFRYLDDFLSRQEFFKKNQTIKQTALDTYMRDIWDGYIKKIYDDIPVQERNDILRKEFTNTDNTALTVFLFNILPNVSTVPKKEIMINDKLMPYITSRLDIKFVPKTGVGDFKIFSLSDKNASINKPSWLNIDGVGYQIQSCVGKLEFVAKATADGKIELNLRGLDVRDPKDNSKRIPYWIDYTKLTINDKTIIDKPTPAWHDKAYYYAIEVKADEELKIQFEWLPHRDSV